MLKSYARGKQNKAARLEYKLLKQTLKQRKYD